MRDQPLVPYVHWHALLFDLGGVVIEIDFGRAFTRWATRAGVPADTIRSRFSFDDAYEQHERGEIEAAEYFVALRASLQIDLSDAELTDGWNAIYCGEVAGIRALLGTGRLPLYAFTNSNPTHQAFWAPRYAELLKSFRKVFVSSEMGLRKPEAVAFAAIAREIGVPVERIMFFDDTRANVEAALAIGMPAVLVRSIDDVKKALGAL
jgi:glucose-1-phosphatase